ncbi:choice-of-anchor L domain-containing protein [bacterium]|nr:choice-of-anchor L domain-containing protein [bacterium]
MKLQKLALIFLIFTLSLVSCGSDEEDDGDTSSGVGQSCQSTFDCRVGLTCDPEKKICVESPDEENEKNDSDSGSSETSDSEHSDDDVSDTGNPEAPDDNDPITGDCTSGETQKCTYQGAPETEDVGPCRAGIRTCKDDGSWGKCEGEVLPVNETGNELCADGIDNDCNGKIDDGTDFDGDGNGSCSDCCETTEVCPFPKEAWDKSNPAHLCEYEEISYDCDSEIQQDSTDPYDYAKAIGICNTTTEDSDKWGLISAEISTPTGLSTDVHKGSNGLLSKLGDLIKPREGGLMLGLSSGKVTDPFTGYTSLDNYSGAPADWLEANDEKFPAAPVCEEGHSGTQGGVRNAVMLTMKIKAPKSARSFRFNIYFLTEEYPKWICSQYNDFFIALLDSEYTSSDPTLQNPADKNLAMDASGNPVGINLAPAGLFTQCKNYNGNNAQNYHVEVTSCIGTDELKGTGFESNGGTGWLTTRGNIVGGEIITLRLAIWDLNDAQYDSLVLIDNFKWDVAEYKPGTGQY